MIRKTARIELTQDEVEILLYIIGDWQSIKSEGFIPVSYPNRGSTATKIYHLFNEIFKALLKRKIGSKKVYTIQ